MTPEVAHFVEEMEAYGTAAGLPRSMARVLGYLTVCEPPEQTASDIQAALGLSAGSVSSAVSNLVRTELIDRVRRPNDRQYYYLVKPDSWKRSLLRSFRAVDHGVAIAENGLKSMPGNVRLKAMRDMYIFFSNEFDRLEKYLSK
jgi:DNA-binding transcriptional regulator GbsR (MarR family)